MISDFELLSDKVDELAGLAHALRRENAGLRASLAVVGAEKNALVERMELAQQRIAALLARLPAAAAQVGADDERDVAPADDDADGDVEDAAIENAERAPVKANSPASANQSRSAEVS